MNRAATIILISIALALVIFVSIYVPLTSGNNESRAVGSTLFNFKTDDIRGVKITNGDIAFELKRGDFGWKIAPEPNDRASAKAIKKLIESARSAIILDRIASREIHDRDQLSQYGLKKSRVRLDFKGDGDPSLLIGKDAADEKRIYVRFENSRDIYLISDELVNQLLRSPQDFRDRSLTNLSPARVDRLVIRQTNGEMELKRDAKGWHIIKPLNARADETAVDALIRKLLGLRITNFLSDKKDNSAQLGLSEPLAEMRLYGEGEKDPQVIRIGSTAPNGEVYAQLLPRGIFCQLPSSISDLLLQNLTSFRDLALARINLDFVDMIRFSSSQTRFALRRNNDGGWKLEEGTRSTHANSAAIEHMVEVLASTKSVRFEPSTVMALEQNGLTKPALTIDFLAVVSENTPESPAGEQSVMELKLATPRADGTIPVHISGSSEIAFVPARLLESLPSDPSAWLAP